MARVKLPRTFRGKGVVSGLSLLGLAILPAHAGSTVSLDSVPTLVLFSPVSTEWDPRDQTLWVADQYLPRIAHIAGDGSPLSVFSCAKYGGGKPAGIALDIGSGHLFISDPDFTRIVRVDPAGNPAGSFDTSSLGIGNPADLAWSASDGSLYVADPTAQAVFHLRPIDANGDGMPESASILDWFSTSPLASSNPMGVALDPASGHLFLSDPALDRVFQLNSSGILLSSFDTGAYGAGSVTGLGWDGSAGNLLITDMGRKVLTFSTGGALLASLGTAAFGSLSPQGLAWDPGSSTLVAVSGERKMLRFQPEAPDVNGAVPGIYLHRQEWTSAFGSIAPTGIALDTASTDRYVVDGYQHRVYRVDVRGAALSSFDTGPVGSTSPTGIGLVSSASSLYLTDSAAQKVFQISTTGTLLGSFSTSPFKHKPQGEPLCNDPEGIAYDGTLDHFFVVDGQVARVFEVTRLGYFVASFSTTPAAAYPTDVAVDPAGDRVIVSDSSGSFAEFTRSGIFRVKYPGVPDRLRMSEGAGVSVEPGTLERVVSDPIQVAVYFLSKFNTALSQISLEPYGLHSPSGAAWLASQSKLFVVDQDLQRLYAVTPGPDATFGTVDDIVASISTAGLGSLMPEGVALNRSVGKVGWVDESNARLYWADLGLGYLGSVDLTPAGATAPRGVDQDPTSAQVFSSDPSSGLLISGPSGNPLQATPWSSLGIADPGGVGLSPLEGILLAVDHSSHSLVNVDLRSYFLPEVNALQFLDSSTMSWSLSPIFGGYQLFRGDLTALWQPSLGGCFWTGANPPAQDVQVPATGSGWFYLVAGRNPTGVGSLGANSDGVVRSASFVAPACP